MDNLAYLKDVPLPKRLAALRWLVRVGAVTQEEAQLLLAVCLEPGDVSTRLAA